jgi:hypothetical protein
MSQRKERTLVAVPLPQRKNRNQALYIAGAFGDVERHRGDAESIKRKPEIDARIITRQEVKISSSADRPCCGFLL